MRDRGVDPLVGVHRRVGDRRHRGRVRHDAAKEVAGRVRQSEFRFIVLEGVRPVVPAPRGDVRVAPVAGQPLERLRHEGGAKPVPLGHGLDHEFEEGMLVRRRERAVELEVHFELAVRVLVIVLVGPPAELQHVVADFPDHVVAAH